MRPELTNRDVCQFVLNSFNHFEFLFKMASKSRAEKGHSSTYLKGLLALEVVPVFVWSNNRLAGLVVKASTLGAEDPRFESRLRRDFSGSNHTNDLKIGTPVATLPGA